MDPVEAKLPETPCEQLSPYRCSQALTPDTGVDDIGDLSLPLSAATDMQLAHADHVALEPHCIRESLLGRARPRLHCSCDKRTCL